MSELMDVAQRLRFVRQAERYFLKQWAAERLHASPRTLDRVAADAWRTTRATTAPTDSAHQWSFLFQAADSRH